MAAISTIISIDLAVAFVIIVLIFYISATLSATESHSLSEELHGQSEFASKIARSYEIISEYSTGRDNEISYARLAASAPERVSLRTSAGYAYGGQPGSYCVERAVYITDLMRAGIIEVC